MSLRNRLDALEQRVGELRRRRERQDSPLLSFGWMPWGRVSPLPANATAGQRRLYEDLLAMDAATVGGRPPEAEEEAGGEVEYRAEEESKN